MKILRITLLTLCLLIGWFVESASAQIRMPRGERQMVRKGLFQQVDSLQQQADSLALANLLLQIDSAFAAEYQSDSIALNALRTDEGSELDSLAAVQFLTGGIKADTTRTLFREGWFMSDSMGLSKVCWMSAVVPGYGQIYNKQYWKLPILYSTVGASLGMCIWSHTKYKPLKAEFDRITDQSLLRTPELNALQSEMIKYNTMKQVFMATTIASYLYFIGDAAVKYSTNEVSHVNKATTLAMVCPGAGQIYNKSYWRVPIVVGGFATTIYCIDWNNRGYQRFKKAYRLKADYDAHPELYPNGPQDEFAGRYNTSFLKNLRNSYRRNRDLCIILTAGLYILQIVDAHVDAHLRDYDISKDLSVSLSPAIGYSYNRMSPYSGGGTTLGMNLSLTF